MTRIDFYLLSSSEAHQRRVTVCRLIEKAYKQGHQIYLRTSCEEETRVMDDLLWTFRQGSFVPHEVLNPELTAEAPVLISHEDDVPAHRDVMINLGDEVPRGHDQFQRLAELIDQDPDTRNAGRKRYRAYQALGYDIHTHELGAAD